MLKLKVHEEVDSSFSPDERDSARGGLLQGSTH